MVCKNCGKEVVDGSKFCVQCGSRLDEAPVAEEVSAAEKAAVTEEAPVDEKAAVTENAPAAEEEAVSGSEATPVVAPVAEAPKQEPASAVPPTNEAPKAEAPKKKGNMKIIGIAVAAVLVLGVVITALNASAAANFFNKTFSKPEKYCQWVEKQTVEDMGTLAGSLYENFLLRSLNSYNSGNSGTVNIKLGEDGQDLLSLAGMAGIDISWFEEGTVTFDSNVKDNAIGANIALLLGKAQLLSANIAVDLDEEMVYAGFPELSKMYLATEDLYTDMDVLKDQLALYQAISKGLPKTAVVEKLAEKYMEIALAQLDDVDMKKSKTIRAEGINQKVTELEVTINGKTLDKMMKAVVEELEKDKDVKEIIVNAFNNLQKTNLDLDEMGLDMDGEEAYEEFLDSLEDAKNQKFSYVEDIVMTIYVDGKGNIRGRSFELASEYGDDIEISFVAPHKGKDFGFKAEFAADGESFTLTGTGKDDGKKLGGEFAVEYNGTSFCDIEVKDFDIKKAKQGFVNGSFVYKLGSGVGKVMEMSSVASIVANMEITIEAKTDAKKADVTIAVTSDEDEYITVRTTCTFGPGKKVSIPAGKNCIEIGDMDDFEDYWDSIKWDDFLKKLDKTDLPSDVVEIIEELSEMDPEDLLYY